MKCRVMTVMDLLLIRRYTRLLDACLLKLKGELLTLLGSVLHILYFSPLIHFLCSHVLCWKYCRTVMSCNDLSFTRELFRLSDCFSSNACKFSGYKLLTNMKCA
jgi:hypothetical protein